jgi:two-component system cell cycle sensor histidine kinase/response regulator CckA
MPATVLIVEDDEPTQKLLETLMNRGGVATLIAANGAAAIEIFDRRDDLACMILDLMMPAVDGPTVLEHISASGRRLPVIVCTAAVTQTMPPFDPAVVRAVVRKPFDIDQLMETVAELIG